MATVCEICGDIGFEQLLLSCDDCKGATHLYCLAKIIFDASVLKGWWCNECQPRNGEVAYKRSLQEVPNQRQPSNGHSDSGVCQPSSTGVESTREAGLSGNCKNKSCKSKSKSRRIINFSRQHTKTQRDINENVTSDFVFEKTKKGVRFQLDKEENNDFRSQNMAANEPQPSTLQEIDVDSPMLSSANMDVLPKASDCHPSEHAEIESLKNNRVTPVLTGENQNESSKLLGRDHSSSFSETIPKETIALEVSDMDVKLSDAVQTCVKDNLMKRKQPILLDDDKEEEADVDVSPSHVPSRKRPRPLCKDQLARPEVPEVGEPAPAVEAAVKEGDITIEILEELPQLAEGSNAMKDWKSMTKKAKRANFYEQARSARDGRFWSIEQEDMYNSVYKTKKFADSRWIDWEDIKHSKEIGYVERKFRNIGLHKLMGTREDWHEETVKQFFSTVYINPSRTSLTWMSGINRKITVTKRFCEEVLLGGSLHSSKIEDKLTDTQEEELKNYVKDDGHFNAVNRLLKKTIYPRAGDRAEVHNDNRVILYHILVEKPFDIADIMFREIEKTRSNNRILIPYAPYIMLLIDRATEGKIVPKTEGYVRHCLYNIVIMETKQTQNKRASKSKTSLRVPPLVKQRQHQ